MAKIQVARLNPHRRNVRGCLGGWGGMYGTPEYRDVSGAGGYKYRQYDDGRIEILPGSPTGAGVIVQPGSSTWQAIVQEIGEFGGSTDREGKLKLEDIFSALERGVQVYQQARSAVAPAAVAPAAAAAPAAVPMVTTPAPAPAMDKTLLWVVIGLGVLGLAAVFLVRR